MVLSIKVNIKLGCLISQITTNYARLNRLTRLILPIAMSTVQIFLSNFKKEGKG